MSAAAHTTLAREFSWMLAALDPQLIESTVCDWSSGALTGVRHAFTFDCCERVPPARIQSIDAQLKDREFPIVDGFVADAWLISGDEGAGAGTVLRVEALLLSP